MRASGHSGLEVIVGSMFSGKSEELIRRVKRAVIARRAVHESKDPGAAGKPHRFYRVEVR